jgi:CheY-like chemotaxis protein
MIRTALLAEDSQDDETLFRHVLKKAGVKFPIRVVRDGQEAIAYLQGAGDFGDREKNPVPDVLFLDLRMPVTNGFTVLEWLQTQPALRERLLVVVLTNFGDVDSIRRSYALGAHSFLHKPLKQEDVENLISHFEGYWARGNLQTPGGGAATVAG